MLTNARVDFFGYAADEEAGSMHCDDDSPARQAAILDQDVKPGEQTR